VMEFPPLEKWARADGAGRQTRAHRASPRTTWRGSRSPSVSRRDRGGRRVLGCGYRERLAGLRPVTVSNRNRFIVLTSAAMACCWTKAGEVGYEVQKYVRIFRTRKWPVTIRQVDGTGGRL